MQRKAATPSIPKVRGGCRCRRQPGSGRPAGARHWGLQPISLPWLPAAAPCAARGAAAPPAPDPPRSPPAGVLGVLERSSGQQGLADQPAAGGSALSPGDGVGDMSYDEWARLTLAGEAGSE